MNDEEIIKTTDEQRAKEAKRFFIRGVMKFVFIAVAVAVGVSLALYLFA
jgi:hypothetical protein